jgi:hypothetical protein
MVTRWSRFGHGHEEAGVLEARDWKSEKEKALKL